MCVVTETTPYNTWQTALGVNMIVNMNRRVPQDQVLVATELKGARKKENNRKVTLRHAECRSGDKKLSRHACLTRM